MSRIAVALALVLLAATSAAAWPNSTKAERAFESILTPAEMCCQFIVNPTTQPKAPTLGIGILYYDKSLNQFLVSENGGAFAHLSSGAGGGNLSGTLTANVLPMATGAHSLADSVFGQNTSALVAAGSTAAVGGIGFNNAGNVEVIADGSTVVNAGIFSDTSSDFTVHDSSNANNWQFLIYNDSDGIANGIVLSNYGAYPNNEFQITFGDGAGGNKSNLVILSPDHDSFFATNFQFGAPGSTLISGSSFGVNFNVSGTADAPNAVNNAFRISGGLTGSQNLLIASGPSSGALSTIIQGYSSNYAALATVGASGNGTSKSQAEMDAGDASGNLHLNLQSPTTSAGTVGVIVISSTQTGSGKAPILQLNTPNDGASGAVTFQAPDSTPGNATIGFTWPSAHPAANGQPLVATTAGVMSFAAGVTKTCTVLPTVVGGIIMAC